MQIGHFFCVIAQNAEPFLSTVVNEMIVKDSIIDSSSFDSGAFVILYCHEGVRVLVSKTERGCPLLVFH